ncbi:signal peptidase I [Quadrisphaera granulorum]|uniref:Signal peptidase I n=1 Tax=Quadrisphaera granulorum TaxID=317664 RepID=A0A316A5V3_9ACTN|nr:signal peptidase I [Quadrisphaera granulorum]PWJ53065.1 signal peptidase I [Quadrisphaera granulorum]SZE97230.1 signal peptidase I [Quadrisphaera granulorum]
MTLCQRVAAVATTLVVVVAAAVVLAVQTGWVTVVVTHGISMNPVYYQGDLVVAARKESYQVGDIVAFDHDDPDASKTRVLHRIIAVQADGIVTKGDNRQTRDPGVTPFDKILGRAMLHVPQAGKLVNAAGSPWGIAVLVGGPLLLSLIGGAAGVKRGGTRARRARARRAEAAGAPSRRQLRPGVPAGSANTERWAQRQGPLPPRPGSSSITASGNPVALGVVLVLGAAGLGLGMSSWTAPPEKTRTEAADDLVRTATFSYTADVRRSPVYDGTTVTSPAPVFRKVATGVYADLAYRGAAGEAGSIDLSAKLSSPGGWTTTMPISSGLRYGGGAADLQEPLDLDAFLARSAAAAAITGLEAQPLAVVLTATVTPDSGGAGPATSAGGPLVATMPLTVTDSRVTLDGDSASLVATAKEPQTRTVTEPGSVSLVGLKLPVQPVRVTAVVLLVLAALGGLVLAILTAVARSRAARADARSTETERVAACLADLLVPVVEIPGAETAVEVISPEALERLARAHELPVLHRRGHGAAVFAVVVEGTTYTWSEHDGEVVSDEGFLLDHVLHPEDDDSGTYARRAPWEEPPIVFAPRHATPNPTPPTNQPLSPRRAAIAAEREPLPDEPSFEELLQPDPFSRLVDPDPFARLGPAARGPSRASGRRAKTNERGSTRREPPPGPSHVRR